MLWNVFLRILNISIISCYTIVVVFVIRALLLKWERKYAYLLWFVVFINLCIPFRVSGPFSLVPSWVAEFDISNGMAYETEQTCLPTEKIEETAVADSSQFESKSDYLPNELITVTDIPQESSVTVHHYYSSDAEENIGIPGTDSNSQTDKIILRNHILAYAWFGGMVLIAAWNLYSFLKLRKSLKNAASSSTEDTDVKIAEKIASPFLWGFFSTVIYLPENTDEEERPYIVAHERYHRKRKDYIVKPVAFVIALVHWFNPLVWASYVLFVRDMEISCDEAVIAGADEDIRKKYAASLLKYAARQNGYTLTPITFGEPSLKSRIKNVLRYKKKNVIISAVILCALPVLMLGLIVAPEKENLISADERQQTQYPENTAVDIPADMQSDHTARTPFGTIDLSALQTELYPEGAYQWKYGVIKGIDGENKYTEALLDSDIVSGRASAFRTFSQYSTAYVIAGEKEGGAITGSLWRVEEDTKSVQPVMQNITMTEPELETISIGNDTYAVINYLTGNRADGRILSITGNTTSFEILDNVSGEKKVDEAQGRLICKNAHDLENETEWYYEMESVTANASDNYQIGQEYNPTEEELARLGGLTPYYGQAADGIDNMDMFFRYCDTAATTKGNARRQEAYAWINRIGTTQNFDVYGTNLIGTLIIRTPDEKYLRIDNSFSSNYNEVPFILENDFDEDGEQELILMGGFGQHGTGIYIEQLFIADKGSDGIWRAYEFSSELYQPMPEPHISSVYSEDGLELLIDGKSTGRFADVDGDASSEYCAGSHIHFGYGESGIVPDFASGEERILGPKDNADGRIILDAKLGIYSDTNLAGDFAGDHFIATVIYKGEGKWEMGAYCLMTEQ